MGQDYRVAAGSDNAEFPNAKLETPKLRAANGGTAHV